MKTTDSKNLTSNKIEDAMRLISIAQNQGPDTENPDHLYLKFIRELFQPEAISMILVDPDNPGTVTKKESDLGADWKIISHLPLKKSILGSALKSSGFTSWTKDDLTEIYDHVIDGVKKIPTTNLVCVPIRSHSVSFGAVSLINPLDYPLDKADEFLLLWMISMLADHLYYASMLREANSTGDELRVSRLQLINSRNALRSVFDNIPQSFYIIDKNYVITAINQARASRTGISLKEIQGRICHEILFGSKKPCEECLISKTFKYSKPTRRVGNDATDKAKLADWEITTYPVIDENGVVEQAILLEQDITERRKLEAELIQSEKLAVIGNLSAGIAHEINNPLTAILVNAQMLLQDLPKDQEENVESVKLIEMAAVRASLVIKNLLGLVRKDQFEIASMDLNESIEKALMLVSHEFLSHRIKVIFDRGENFPVFYGSTTDLQGVWINLLLNAIEAIGDQPGEIKITSHYEDGKFYVEVRDTGSGITDANLDKIFEPYFTTKRSGKGTGLGLSISMRTIRGHGGQIMVESSPGSGARFTITLPENQGERSE
jgi:PAS domain S-box-containing protein